jgi:hypothetical protein
VTRLNNENIINTQAGINEFDSYPAPQAYLVVFASLKKNMIISYRKSK